MTPVPVSSSSAATPGEMPAAGSCAASTPSETITPPATPRLDASVKAVPRTVSPWQGRTSGRAGTGTEARERLRDLLRHSCEFAHEEGLVIYTVSLLSPSQSVSQGWKAQLVACSGNSETTTDAQREEYHLQGTDRDSLVAAFREIGERLISVRRTS